MAESENGNPEGSRVERCVKESWTIPVPKTVVAAGLGQLGGSAQCLSGWVKLSGDQL